MTDQTEEALGQLGNVRRQEERSELVLDVAPGYWAANCYRSPSPTSPEPKSFPAFSQLPADIAQIRERTRCSVWKHFHDILIPGNKLDVSKAYIQEH